MAEYGKAERADRLGVLSEPVKPCGLLAALGQALHFLPNDHRLPETQLPDIVVCMGYA